MTGHGLSRVARLLRDCSHELDTGARNERWIDEVRAVDVARVKEIAAELDRVSAELEEIAGRNARDARRYRAL